jgi:hypothetical protein
MAGAHENLEHAEHAQHAAGHNKKIALLIAVIALFLALSETLGKSAQTSALNHQIEASNLWNFFQAKNIRRTVTLVAADIGKLEVATTDNDARKTAVAKQVDEWTKTAARYRSEPDVREGTVELAQRAKEEEAKRDTMLARYHHYELASAGFQIGIVLASATVITGMIALTWLAGALALMGIGFTAIGLLAPHAVHLF